MIAEQFDFVYDFLQLEDSIWKFYSEVFRLQFSFKIVKSKMQLKIKKSIFWK